jgi:hypothetical protein
MPWTTSLLKVRSAIDVNRNLISSHRFLQGFVMFLAVNPFFAIFFTYDVIGALGSELGTPSPFC